MGELEQYLRSRLPGGEAEQSRRQQEIHRLRRQIQQELTGADDLKHLPPEEARRLAWGRAWIMVQEAAETEYRDLLLTRDEKALIVRRVMAGMFGLGPLEDLVHDPNVTEVMVNGPHAIFVERRVEGHRAVLTRAMDPLGGPLCFDDSAELLTIIERIVAPVNRKVDESNPIVDARLPNGSRVNVVLSPVSLDGHALTIRTFPEPITVERLVEIGSLPCWLAELLQQMVLARYNLVISGGTGSGKTTFLNALSQFIPREERVVTVEDAAELQLRQVENLVRLEARPPNLEGKGAIPIRDLVRTALRMRPDRIIVGEVRGGEALDMLQAMNTGHDGSMTTGHANSARDMISRLETMVLMSGVDLPLPAVRRQIGAAVDVIIHLSRMPDRSRKVVQVSEVSTTETGEIVVRDLALRTPGGDLEPTGLTMENVHKFRLAGIHPDSPLVRLE
ncbi:MAG TPA: CpaF family protein [Symbiobacteriaceae bacterium]